MIKLLYAEYSQMVNNPLVLVFFTTILADFLTGLASAWQRGTLDSRVGFKGTAKHLALVIVILLFYPYLGIFDLTALAYPFLLNFIAQYGISILENLGEIGIEVPSDLTRRLHRLKDKEEEGQ